MLKTDYLEVKEHGSAPGTPPSGALRIYADTSGNFKVKNDAGSESGLGGGGASSGAMADIPAAGTNGRIYQPTDDPHGYIQFLDNGSTWDRFAFGRKLTKPVLANFSWVNQGGATATQTEAGITLTAPTGATDDWRILKIATPTPPYKIRALILFKGWRQPAGGPFIHSGLVWRQSSDGKLEAYGYTSYNAAYTLDNLYFTSVTAYSSTLSTDTTGLDPAIPIWLELEDNNTTRYFRWSKTGLDYKESYNQPRTTTITPDEIGIALDNGNTGASQSLYLVHWEQL